MVIKFKSGIEFDQSMEVIQKYANCSKRIRDETKLKKGIVENYVLLSKE